ncbi:MAG TPA: FtsX-like permease family protein, partial [Blastocatellia bacterium]
AFIDRLNQAVAALPGVQSVGLTSNLPLRGIMFDPITIQGKPQSSASDMTFVEKEAITPGYFKTVGVELIRGRDFDDNDRADTENVCIINQTMARQLFNGEDPIGKEVKHGQPEDPFPWMKVVGIVGDVRHGGLDSQASPGMFMPYRQVIPLYVDALARKMSLSVRATAISGPLASSIRDAIWSLNGDMPIYDVKTMDNLISESAAEPRMRTTLLGAFAVLAIIMASVGLYGVMSQAVLRRQHELGIRLALGASSADVLRLVLAEGMALAAVGVVAGLLGAFALARLASSLLFGVSARDPMTYVMVSIFLLLVSLAASYLPARRATRVDPLSTLRSE